MKVANSITERTDNGWKEMKIQFKRLDVVFKANVNDKPNEQFGRTC
jgi:hypothetical protein